MKNFFIKLKKKFMDHKQHVFVILLYRKDHKPEVHGIHSTKKLAEEYLLPIQADIFTRRIFKVPLYIFNDNKILDNFLEDARYNFKQGFQNYLFPSVKNIEPIRLEIKIVDEPAIFDMDI